MGGVGGVACASVRWGWDGARVPVCPSALGRGQGQGQTTGQIAAPAAPLPCRVPGSSLHPIRPRKRACLTRVCAHVCACAPSALGRAQGSASPRFWVRTRPVPQSTWRASLLPLAKAAFLCHNTPDSPPKTGVGKREWWFDVAPFSSRRAWERRERGWLGAGGCGRVGADLRSSVWSAVRCGMAAARLDAPAESMEFALRGRGDGGDRGMCWTAPTFKPRRDTPVRATGISPAGGWGVEG